MKGKTTFTPSEIEAIKRLIDKKVVASTEEQKRIRDEIRDVYKFYFSDFSSKKGYTVNDFQNLINSGEIKVIKNPQSIEKCRIGADELILWLRKNNFAISIPNDEIHGLGQKIFSIIEELNGIKVLDNFPSHWANSEKDKNIGKYNLPMTSAQYEIDFGKISDLYKELSKL